MIEKRRTCDCCGVVEDQGWQSYPEVVAYRLETKYLGVSDNYHAECADLCRSCIVALIEVVDAAMKLKREEKE